jgi:hypothetical protein
VRGLPDTTDTQKGLGLSSWTVTVRDGDSALSNLLFLLSGNGAMDGGNRPTKSDVVSTGNIVRVEYTPATTPNERDSNNNFVAVYSAIGNMFYD